MNQYPKEAGYQAHSNTSQEAAENLASGEQQRNHVLRVIGSHGAKGATTDEVRVILLNKGLIHENSIMSARVRELELQGAIVKTTIKRKTSAGRNANVYVSKNIFDLYSHEMQKDEVKPESKIDALEKRALTPQHNGLKVFQNIFYRNPHLRNTFSMDEITAIETDLKKV